MKNCLRVDCQSCQDPERSECEALYTEVTALSEKGLLPEVPIEEISDLIG